MGYSQWLKTDILQIQLWQFYSYFSFACLTIFWQQNNKQWLAFSFNMIVGGKAFWIKVRAALNQNSLNHRLVYIHQTWIFLQCSVMQCRGLDYLCCSFIYQLYCCKQIYFSTYINLWATAIFVPIFFKEKIDNFITLGEVCSQCVWNFVCV